MEHQVQGRAILPGTGLLEMADAATELLLGHTTSSIGNVSVERSLSRCVMSAPIILDKTVAVPLMHVIISFDAVHGYLKISSPNAESINFSSNSKQCWCSHGNGSKCTRTDSNLSQSGVVVSLEKQHERRRTQRDLSQTARIDVTQRWQIDGYCSNPAIVDSCLHLGASLSHISTERATLLIPAAIELYVNGKCMERSTTTSFHAGCQLHGIPNRQSARSSYCLQYDKEHASGSQIVMMEAKQATTSGVRLRNMERTGRTSKSSSGLYCEQWEASWPANRSTAQETAPSCTSRRDPRNILATNCTRNTWHSIPSKCTHRANLAAPLSATLSWLRHATVASMSPDGRSHVASCGIGLNNLEVVATPLNLIGAAVAGMVRVASSEAAAQMQWSVMEMDHVASDNLVTLIDQDPAGTRFWHALALRPLLKPLVRPPTSSQPTDQSVCYNGAVALTGGLGGELTTADYRVRVCAHTLTDSVCPSATWFPFFAGIGSLLGVWLARVTAAVPVLLGRSGRFSSPAPADLLNAARPLVTLRCDASAGEETAAALGSNAAEFGGLAAVLHAGGVLQDAVLPQQTARSIKAVVAPKLCFMMHAMRAAQFHAVQAVNLFSSVAAFIGSPGQANYAAANSALDCWSLAMQQCGIPGKCSEMYRHFCIGRAFSVCSD